VFADCLEKALKARGFEPLLAQTDRCQLAEFTAALEGGADLPRHRE
jgi:hypothetical protein